MNKILLLISVFVCSFSFGQSPMINYNHRLDTVTSLSQVSISAPVGFEVYCTCDSMQHIMTASGLVPVFDSLHDARAFKVKNGYVNYAAILSQSGTSAPTSVRGDVNFPGITFTWARTSAGTYTLTASSPIFTTNKTSVFISAETNATYRFVATITSTTVITINTSVLGLVVLSTLTDGLLNNAAINVAVYN